MKPNKDLFIECNDGKSGMTVEQFEEVFCQQCRNRECVRANWAFSTWDKRILTQVDRLLLNPNIVRKEESSRWEGISNLETFHEPETIEVWGQPPQQEDNLVVIEEPKTTTEPTTVIVETQPAPTVIESEFNTAPQSVSFGAVETTVKKVDPWSVSSEVPVGGKFKMGQ